MKITSALLTCITLLTIYGCSMWGDPGIPNDVEVIEKYTEHKEEFESLLRIARSTSGKIYLNTGSDFVPKQTGLSKDEWTKSIELMKSSEVEVLITPYTGQGEIYVFSTNSYGNVSGGWSKGIVYTESKSYRTFDKLNEIPQDAERMEYLLKPIEKNWYLYLKMDG